MYGWKTDVIQVAGAAPTAFQYKIRYTSAFYNLINKQMLDRRRALGFGSKTSQPFLEQIKLMSNQIMKTFKVILSPKSFADIQSKHKTKPLQVIEKNNNSAEN